MKIPLRARHAFACSLALCLSTSLPAADSTVQVWEQDEVIPTYLAGPPDPNPMFYFGRGSQGAEGRTYPYPLYDNLTNQKEDKSYRLVYLENEYLKVGIAPEIGGRIFSGVDKTNGYNFFYRQHVIKPALIGLIGAWISGGVEWNIPHHHRASTFIPVQHRIEENADGSKTVWVGELEVRHRMRWAIGYTLRPGKSYLEVAVRILNRTPLVNTMLCFANVAVNANENYQIIFPPSTEYVTHHTKREFTTWPLATKPYGGVDWQGEDVSWYKNHFNANSMFAWNYWDDFFAGYDHGAEAGTMSIADHHIVPGKKFWTWGNGPRGRMWDDILTDDDGPYVELMVGAYSDNQPDYSWLQPYDGRIFTMYWYPFRDIGGVKQANLQAAANLDFSDDGRTAKFGFNTTSAHPQATVTISAAGRTLLNEQIAINPGKPYVNEVKLPAGTKPTDVRTSLTVGGRELVGYSPAPPRGDPMPDPYRPPPEPSEFQTNEELLLAGQRAFQFHSPSLEPDPFWDEALRRDPDDARVNTAYGIVKLKRMAFAEAEEHFRIAIKRLEFPFTTPKNAEPYYYLGLALKAQGLFDAAYDAFFKATWNGEWKAPAYFELAQIASRHGDLVAARDHVTRSLAFNAYNLRAQNLLAAIVRHTEGAANSKLLAAQQPTDPLDVTSLAERSFANDQQAGQLLATALRDHPQTGLETVADYGNAGLFDDAAAILDQMIALAPDAGRIDPMVHYYRAHFAELAGDQAKAAAQRKRAQQVSTDYAFPFQAEAIHVLERAMEADPQDAQAPFLLGNLLFDSQPNRAIALWEKAVDLQPGFAVALRNLALAYSHRGTKPDFDRAIANLEAAIKTGQSTPVHFTELDQLYEAAGASVEKRLSLMEAHRDEILARDDSTANYVNLLTFTGKPGMAINLLSNRTFNIWEGGTRFNSGDAWTDAHLTRGKHYLAAGKNQEALADFEAAGEYPENLRAERRGEGRTAEVAYWTGVAQAALGNQDAAQSSWEHAVAVDAPRPRRGGNNAATDREVQQYYQALALRKLGDAASADAMMRSVRESGQDALAGLPATIDYYSSFGEGRPERSRVADAHFVAGLGHAGLGEAAEAVREFNAALAASPDHLGAKLALEALSSQS